MVQWLRIHLPMQGMGVWSLVWEDPICCRTTKPMCHNYWARTLDHPSCSYWSLHACSLCVHKRSHCNGKPILHTWRIAPIHCNQRKPTHNNKDPAQPKISQSTIQYFFKNTYWVHTMCWALCRSEGSRENEQSPAFLLDSNNFQN